MGVPPGVYLSCVCSHFPFKLVDSDGKKQDFIFWKKQGLHVEMDAGRVVVRNQVIVLLLNYYLAFYWGPVASQY